MTAVSFIKAKFPDTVRHYTWRNPGIEIAVGDKVRIPTRTGGQAVVEVVEVGVPEPTYECRDVIEKLAPEASS